MFAIIYEGCRCAESWRVRHVEDIDPNGDNIYERLVCDICGQDVSQEKKSPDGKTMIHVLTEEEIQSELSANEMYDDEDCYPSSFHE
jgi:hypothetical protein